MVISHLIEKNGAQFFNRVGNVMNGQKYFAIIRPKSPSLAIDEFSTEAFESLYEAFHLDPEDQRRIFFMASDGKIKDLDIYLVDVLPKNRYSEHLVNNLAFARNEYSFFDVEFATEIKVVRNAE